MNTVRAGDKRYPLSLPWNDGATEMNMELRPLQIFDPVTGPVPISLTKSRQSPTQQTLHYSTVCLSAQGLIGKEENLAFINYMYYPTKYPRCTSVPVSKEQKKCKEALPGVSCSNSAVSPLPLFLCKKNSQVLELICTHSHACKFLQTVSSRFLN